MALDMEALARAVQAKLADIGLNVRYTDKDTGEVKLLSFATVARRDNFMVRATHQGHAVEIAK